MAGVRDNTVSNVVSGGIASFKSVGEVPLKSLKVNFNPIQEGDGDPSPSNIMPIEGWTGLNVYKGSKNFLTDTVVFVSTVRKTEMEYTVQNNSATIDRKANVSAFILIKALDNITSDMVGMQFVYTASNYNINDAIVSCNSTGNNRRTVTNGIITNEDVGKMLTVRFYAGGEIQTYTATNMQLSLNSTSTTYEPYNGTTVPVSWSDLGTVYCGYVDLISGEVWKTFWQYTFTGQQTFYTSGSNWVVAYMLPVDSYYPTAATPFQGICSHYPYAPYTKGRIGVMYNERTCTFDATIYDAAGWKQYCADQYAAGTPVQVAYRLKNPQLIGTISPIEIKSLIGVNNIWSNADTVEAQYCALESLQIYKQRFKTNEPHLQSVSDNIASFQTDMVAPLKECKVYFEPWQFGSGNPSPTNVRAVYGWSDINNTISKKNLFHLIGYSANNVNTINATRKLTNSYGTTLNTNQPDSSVTITQEQWPNTTTIFSYQNGYFAIIDDNLQFEQKYNFSFKVTNITNNPLNAVLSNIRLCTPDGGQTVPTSIDNNTLIYKNVKYGRYMTNVGGIERHGLEIRNCGMSFTLSDFMATKVDEQDMTYEPFKGFVTNITLPSTYYGGWIDLITGEVWATYEYTNLGEKNWTADDQTTQPGCFRSGNSNFGGVNGIKYMGANYCSQFTAVQKSSWTQVGYGEISVTNATFNPIVRIRDERFIDKTGDEVKTLLSGVYYAYERAVPRLVGTLTSQQLKTLKNQNNIWSNTNGITQVKYWTHGNIADKRKVVWNNLVNGYLTSVDWQDRNSSETNTTFENGIATTQFISTTGQYHTMISKASQRTYQGHKYYSRFDCMVNTGISSIGMDVAGINWVKIITVPTNEWGTYSNIVTGQQDRNSTAYVPRMPQNLPEGTVTKSKNALIIDLTLMFGAGKEPSTTEEFEALCIRNGIDFTQPQPQNITGTQMYWYF